VKITDVRTYTVRIRPDVRAWLFVKVETDAGIHGWGEATVEGKEASVAEAIREYAGRHLIGQDPQRIEYLWQTQYRHSFWRGGVILQSAISGVDQALWDIAGKIAGQPVYQLLGGACRDRVKLYTHVAIGMATEQTAADAQALVAAGWVSLKMSSFAPMRENHEADAVRVAVARAAAVRDAIGGDVELLVDNHGRTRASVACRMMDALAPYDIAWFEEPVPPEDLDGFRQVKAYPHTTDIATGERYFSPWEFRDIIEGKLTDIVQPDVCHAGGITGLRKIAAMAEAHGIQFAPHNPQGPLSTAASIHLCFALPHFRILECYKQLHLPEWAELHAELVPIAPGWAEPPTAPGLGIEFNEAALAKYAYTPEARYGGVFEGDGSPAHV